MLKHNITEYQVVPKRELITGDLLRLTTDFRKFKKGQIIQVNSTSGKRFDVFGHIEDGIRTFNSKRYEILMPTFKVGDLVMKVFPKSVSGLESGEIYKIIEVQTENGWSRIKIKNDQKLDLFYASTFFIKVSQEYADKLNNVAKVTREKDSMKLEIKLPNKRPAHTRIAKDLFDKGQIDLMYKYAQSFQGKPLKSAYQQFLADYKRRARINGEDALKRPNNFYLNKLLEKFRADRNHKVPTKDQGSWLGVEIECFLPYSAQQRGMERCMTRQENSAGVMENCGECAFCTGSDYCNSTSDLMQRIKEARVSFAYVKHDGSIRPDEGFFPVEITCITNINDMTNLERLCTLLRKLGAKVNKSCGLHVHFDQRDLDAVGGMDLRMQHVKRRAMRIYNCVNLFKKMIPPSRAGSSYAKSNTPPDFSNERYHAVNLRAYEEHRTIEVRMHSATTSFKKISGWIKLINLIQRNENVSITKTINTVDELCENHAIPADLVEYINERIEKFSNPKTADSEDTSAVA